MILNCTWEEYCRLPGEHATQLKAALTSPLHYHDLVANGRQPTKSLALGAHAHALVLEPETVDGTVAVWDGPVKRGKEWDAFKKENEGRRIVTPAEHEKASRIADAVHSHPIAGDLLRLGRPEVAFTWEDNGTWFKAREDWISGPYGLVGLKTCADPTDRAFRTAAEKYGYLMQWGMYWLGWLRNTGHRVPVQEIVVGSNPPHEVFVYQIPQDILDVGIEQYQLACAVVEKCTREGHWPGRGEDHAIEFRRADWAVAQEDTWEMEDA